MTCNDFFKRLNELVTLSQMTAEARDEIKRVLAEGWDDDGTSAPTSVLLKIPPQKEPVYFLVQGFRSNSHGDDYDGSRYWYEEGTCPTNWIGNTHAIQVGEESDPHGLFEFCAWEPGEPRENEGTAGSRHLEEMVAKYEKESA